MSNVDSQKIISVLKSEIENYDNTAKTEEVGKILSIGDGIATIYGDLGQADQALPYLKQAIDLGGEDVRQAARTQSHFDKIRNNKQFQQIVG